MTRPKICQKPILKKIVFIFINDYLKKKTQRNYYNRLTTQETENERKKKKKRDLIILISELMDES